MSKNKNIDWIGDSISETLIGAIASAGQSVVYPENRDQLMVEMGLRRYALLTRASVMEIAINASADQVLSGSFEVNPAQQGGPSKASLKIQAFFVDVKRSTRGPEFAVSGSFEELSTLQTRLCWQILASMNLESSTEQDYLRLRPPIRIDALESYVRGLLATSQDQKYKLFASAARLEPGFSPPRFELGKLQFWKHEYRSAAEWLETVQPSDIHYREALFFLGLSRYQIGDFQAARRAFEKVAETVPTAEVLSNLGVALLRTGEPGAADLFRRAVEMDPADPDLHFNLGYALWRSGDRDAAADSFRAALSRRSDDPTATLLLGLCISQQGPRPGDLRTESQERLKTEYREAAWLALKAMLKPRPEEN